MRLGEVRSELAKTLSTQLQRQSPLADRRLQESYDSRVSIGTIEGKQIAIPWVERLPIYKSFGNLYEMKSMIQGDKDWNSFIDFLDLLKSEKVGHPNPIFFNPYAHQADAVRDWWEGKDVVVSTGTGSGKTECFLWPLLGHLWRARARGKGDARGVKAIVLYPMNALATDQMKRIRLMFGHPELAEKLANGETNPGEAMDRLFQFMLYTGRTYAHGPHHEISINKDGKESIHLSNNIRSGGKSLRFMEVLEHLQKNKSTGINTEDSLFKKLFEDGFLPRIGTPDFHTHYRDYSGRTTDTASKRDRLTTKKHDTELLFRHEAHNVGYKIKKKDGSIVDKVGTHEGGTPDLLFTNYSMLDYMLNRPIEDAIWEDTKSWLEEEENKLLIVLDEAHLYQGMSGLHIGHLLRRLYLNLGLQLDDIDKKIQFILTSASLGKDPDSKIRFNRVLTSKEAEPSFIVGKEWNPISNSNKFDKMVENGLSNKLYELGTEYSSLTEDGQSKFFNDFLEQFSNCLGLPRVECWFNEIRNSEFFNTFYNSTDKPIRVDKLGDLLWSNPESSADETQTLLDLFTTQVGPHPGTNQPAPLVSIRAHMMTRGLPRLHIDISSKEWKILDGPQPILLSNSKSTPSRPLLLLGCRSCGAPYVRVWVPDIIKWEQNGTEKKESTSSVLQGFIEGEFDSSKPHFEIRSEPNEIIERSIGLDLYLLNQKDGKYFIRGSSKDSNNDRSISRIDGWMNRFDGRLIPRWEKSESPETNDDWIPFILPSKQGDGVEFVSMNKEENPNGEISPGSVFTFNHDSACVRCMRQYSRSMRMDQIIDFETRGDGNFASLTKRLLEIQTSNPKISTPNRGRKVLAFSDSRQRAARLAVEVQRISNIDEFRNLLIHMLHHPWYKSLPRESKNLAKIYPDFILYAASMAKEPLEHSPSLESDLHGFSIQRSRVVAAHLSEILKQYEPDYIQSILTMPEMNFLTDQSRELIADIISMKDSSSGNYILDDIFIDLVYKRIQDNEGEYKEGDKSKKLERLKQRSKQKSLDSIQQFEFSEARKSLQKIIKKSIGDSKTDDDLSSYEMTWRILRLIITEDKSDNPLINECMDAVNKALDDPSNDFERIAKKWFKKEKEYHENHSEEWKNASQSDAQFHYIKRTLVEQNPVEISLLSKLIITLYLKEDDKSKRFETVQNAYTRMTPKLVRPQASFIGSIIRIIGQQFLSVDQIGLAYVGLSEKSKKNINANLYRELSDDENIRFNNQINKSFGIEQISDEGVGRIISLLDGMVQALARSGNSEDKKRGACCLAIHDITSGFTKKNMRTGLSWERHFAANEDELSAILETLQTSFSERKFLLEYMRNIFPEIQVADKQEYNKLSPEAVQIYPINQSTNLRCCSICSRPHPHPLDVDLDLCRWCRDSGKRVPLIEFNPQLNDTHRQRIDEPWRKPFWELNPGAQKFLEDGVTIIRAEEHTAQIGDHVKEDRLLSRAIEFELLFQDIPFVMPKRFGTSTPEPVIDVLSCTTTMEVGIDIGSLIAVALRTVPRDAASYQQRVGRAGRKRAQVCAALSWFDNSQYAQSYFHSPEKLLNHPSEAPKVYGFNEHVSKQHIRMAILSLFTKRKEYNKKIRVREGADPKKNLMESHGNMDNFFGDGSDNFDEMKSWIEDEWNNISKRLETIVFDTEWEIKIQLIEDAKNELIQTLETINESWEGST